MSFRKAFIEQVYALPNLAKFPYPATIGDICKVMGTYHIYNTKWESVEQLERRVWRINVNPM